MPPYVAHGWKYIVTDKMGGMPPVPDPGRAALLMPLWVISCE